MENKYFKCYICHYHNNFFILKRIKGKCCKNCGTFNYFNFKRKNRNYTTNNLSKSFSRLGNNYKQNKIGSFSNNYNPNQNGSLFINSIPNQKKSLYNNNSPNQNGFLFNNNCIPNRNIFPSINSIPNRNVFPSINYIPNRNEFLFNNNNANSISFNYSSSNFFNNQVNSINNINNNNINYNLNSNNNEEEENESLLNNYSNKYYWLTKQKTTKEYIDSECTICLDTIKENEIIHITKCKHVFHYKCIKNAIDANIMDCPLC